LTASGGPFLNKSINNVKKIDVLRHPVWQMGVKITVDSATMMNKGLEVIEAHHLFNLSADAIKVVVHPEALCHSLVQFADGTLLAQLSSPDMKLPIQYALTAPRRTPSLVKYLEIDKVKKLTFLPPDFRKFPCLKCAYDALKIGKSMPAVLNAANEELVKLFLEDKVKFNEIATTLKSVMNRHKPKKGNINLYLEYAKWSKEMVRSLVC
jgi:1-deoxy-D-xylulose-5-phosphate reductoisomerase